MIIRKCCTVISFISIFTLTGEIATAEDSRNSQPIELFVLAQNSYLTPVQQKRFESLSPEEQKRIIRNYRKYQRLPQNQRKKMRNNYNQWQKMSPEERQNLKESYEKYKRKSPQKRRHRR